MLPTFSDVTTALKLLAALRCMWIQKGITDRLTHRQQGRKSQDPLRKPATGHSHRTVSTHMP